MRCKAVDCFTCPYPDCINPEPLRIQTLTREQKDRMNARQRETRKAYKAAGLCSTCGRPRDDTRWMRCSRCRASGRRYQEKIHRKAGHLPKCLLDGVERCAHCGKAAPVEGYRLCEKCLADARAALAKSPTHIGRGCATPFFANFNGFPRK